MLKSWAPFSLLMFTSLCVQVPTVDLVEEGKNNKFCEMEEYNGDCNERTTYFAHETFDEEVRAATEKLSNAQLRRLVKSLKDKMLNRDFVLAKLFTGQTHYLTDAPVQVAPEVETGALESKREHLLDSLLHSLRDGKDAREDSGDDGDGTVEQFEFPPLTRVSPGNVGDSVHVALEDGKWLTRITRAVSPPVFEIPNFLSDEECNMVIKAAVEAGLNVSNLFGAEINEEYDKQMDMSEISRISEQTWLFEKHVGTDFWNDLQRRLSKVTETPIGVIKRGEPIQVVSYVSGGHYHAHVDSTDTDYLPCCIQIRCGKKEGTSEWAECCRLCRYITVLYYLNEPEEGGETAFPLADMPEDLVEEKFVNIEEQEWPNLSRYCHNASLRIRPTRGTAIMWYSHLIDEQTGYLGRVDRRSHHGGCDLIKGTKWIANNWIPGTTYQDRSKPGVFYTGP